MNTGLRALFALILIFTVSGCYMPIRFDAEIELTRTGYYEFFFDGYIAKVQLYDGLRKGEVDREDELRQAELIKTDFTRDSSTKAFEYFKKGHFRVKWERKGDLTKAKSVTFFRRNERMLGIDYNSRAGTVHISGRSIKRDIKQRLRDSGLDTSGEIRVITDANVATHNATSVKKFLRRGPRFKIYTWKINNIFTWKINNIFAPTPSMTIRLH